MVIKNSSELEQIFMSGKYMGKKVLLELEKPLRLKPKYPIVIFSVLLAVLMCVLVFNSHDCIHNHVIFCIKLVDSSQNLCHTNI